MMRYSVLIRNWRINGSIVGQCISDMYPSKKPLVQVREKH
jgi:hypothetical protein